jgi:hypothetical protein
VEHVGWYYLGDEVPGTGLYIVKLGALPEADVAQIASLGVVPPDLRLVLSSASLADVTDAATGAVPYSSSVYSLWCHEPYPCSPLAAPLKRSDAGVVGCTWVPCAGEAECPYRVTVYWYDVASGGVRLGVWW